MSKKDVKKKFEDNLTELLAVTMHMIAELHADKNQLSSFELTLSELISKSFEFGLYAAENLNDYLGEVEKTESFN